MSAQAMDFAGVEKYYTNELREKVNRIGDPTEYQRPSKPPPAPTPAPTPPVKAVRGPDRRFHPKTR